ncbi:hypothetical protein J4467_01495 [Candidatus Woesearchaeota archaeon]|nr:hypothetical protein [Candidatus Woesearchaeota archaeon]
MTYEHLVGFGFRLKQPVLFEDIPVSDLSLKYKVIFVTSPEPRRYNYQTIGIGKINQNGGKLMLGNTDLSDLVVYDSDYLLFAIQ